MACFFPLQMCVIGCELFVASYSTDGVYVISFDGVILRRITARLPWAITFDSNRKHLIVLSTLSLTAFDLNGKEMWKRDSHRQNGLNYFLTFDKKSSNIILSYQWFSYFQVYNSDGAVLRHFHFSKNGARIESAAVLTPLDEFIVICKGDLITMEKDTEVT